MADVTLPRGFSAASLTLRDLRLALISVDLPATAWVLATENLAAAPSVSRSKSIVDNGHLVSGVLVTVGNANAFTKRAAQDEEALAASLAANLASDPRAVLTAATGELGRPLPVQAIDRALPALLARRSSDPTEFAHAILLTDSMPKLVSQALSLSGHKYSITVIAKGASRIAPDLATLLVFVLTDLPLTRDALRMAVESAAATTLEQLDLEGEPSTNDALIALSANGDDPFHPGDPETATFTKELARLLHRIVELSARDAAQGLRFVQITVVGASSFNDARALALGIASSPIVRESLRQRAAGAAVASALGACAAMIEYDLDLGAVWVSIDGLRVLEAGVLRAPPPRMRAETVELVVAVGEGSARGEAFCAETRRRRVTRPGQVHESATMRLAQ
ncbi:MAG: bifunctional ornithine acetyltransferase/N-acetylglutamate synthase [Deltaproteobacteria bacterium]|nr:bifunctional ornithine acetyltransferase/N-acetylglutamate synthase [Deltaproteobacteria bacterium]